MHWTTLSDQEIFALPDAKELQRPQYDEIVLGDALIIVENLSDGQRRVHRLISPHSRDYLEPKWQPGTPYVD